MEAEEWKKESSCEPMNEGPDEWQPNQTEKEANNNEDFIERLWRSPKHVMNLVVIGINIALFLLVELTGGSHDANNMIRWGAAYTPLVREGEYYRMFTSMFLHFGAEHLLSNMMLLLFMGDYLEKFTGKITYLTVYFVGGMAGSLCSFLYEEAKGQEVIAAGASGAVFAVTGALIILLIAHKGRLEDLTIRRMVVMSLITLLVGFQEANVDNFAHLGGFAGGMIVMTILQILVFR